jgi:hypothetical protein
MIPKFRHLRQAAWSPTVLKNPLLRCMFPRILSYSSTDSIKDVASGAMASIIYSIDILVNAIGTKSFEPPSAADDERYAQVLSRYYDDHSSQLWASWCDINPSKAPPDRKEDSPTAAVIHYDDGMGPVISSSSIGGNKKKIGPSLSAEEIKRLREESEKRKEDEKQRYDKLSDEEKAKEKAAKAAELKAARAAADEKEAAKIKQARVRTFELKQRPETMNVHDITNVNTRDVYSSVQAAFWSLAQALPRWDHHRAAFRLNAHSSLPIFTAIASYHDRPLFWVTCRSLYLHGMENKRVGRAAAPTRTGDAVTRDRPVPVPDDIMAVMKAKNADDKKKNADAKNPVVDEKKWEKGLSDKMVSVVAQLKHRIKQEKVSAAFATRSQLFPIPTSAAAAASAPMPDMMVRITDDQYSDCKIIGVLLAFIEV